MKRGRKPVTEWPDYERIRDQVIFLYYDLSMPIAEIAYRVGISEPTVYKVLAINERPRENGGENSKL